jgi:hypothetical protein
MVEPGKYTTLGVPRRTGMSSGREKSPASGAMRSQGNSRVVRNIDRYVDRRAQRADQQPALDAFAAAVLDQLAAAAGEARDGREMPARERQLGARYVVLGESADAREQAAARGIVEILGRKRLLRARKPGDDVLAENR